MCCMMQITTNSAKLMDEAVDEWAKDTYHPRGPYQALREEGVTFHHDSGQPGAVFTLTGNGHHTSPASWVAAVKGMVTLYNWGLRLNPDSPSPESGRWHGQARWVAEHLGQPCDQRIVGENGHPIDLQKLCWGGAPMGPMKAQSMVMDEHKERHSLDADSCSCGCETNCGEEPSYGDS